MSLIYNFYLLGSFLHKIDGMNSESLIELRLLAKELTFSGLHITTLFNCAIHANPMQKTNKSLAMKNSSDILKNLSTEHERKNTLYL